MHQRHFLLFYFLVFGLFFAGFGQSPINDHCDNPTPLCFNEWIKGSNYNATTQICDQCSDWSSDNSCFELQNTVWFNFLTLFLLLPNNAFKCLFTFHSFS